VLGAVLDRKIPPALYVQDELREPRNQAVFRLNQMENLPILFLDIQKRDPIDGSPIGRLSSSLGIEDRFVQDERRFIARISHFQNIRGIRLGSGEFIIGGSSFHILSIVLTGFSVKGFNEEPHDKPRGMDLGLQSRADP
jgi:hypothetical protein